MHMHGSSDSLWLVADTAAVAAAANCVWGLTAAQDIGGWSGGTVTAIAVVLAVLAIATIAVPGRPNRTATLKARHLKHCYRGVSALKTFWWSAIISCCYHLTAAFALIPGDWKLWLASAGVSVVVESLLFWRGMITVYCNSLQLGLKIRAVGLACGWIPIANLFMLIKIIRTVDAEVLFEEAKEQLDCERAGEQVCATTYPILLVHGVFFRDSNVLNYWGRIPNELIRNGATIHYGNHQSASSVADSARELTERIKVIVERSGCGKVNVIAHSKGGLDIRYAIARYGAGQWVASLTTINTPHRGCGFADYLLSKIPLAAQHQVEAAYNAAAAKFGDVQPDFMASVHDLTQAGVARLNAEMQREPDNGSADGTNVAAITRPSAMAEPINNSQFDGIVCRSVGSRLGHATTGKFPLNFTYPLVKWFDGPNDGLVAEPSFPWGENFTWLQPQGKRGISHADMIDLNRENIEGFDVREFYVQLVADLKQRGL